MMFLVAFGEDIKKVFKIKKRNEFYMEFVPLSPKPC
jgi:hypothetical protein